MLPTLEKHNEKFEEYKNLIGKVNDLKMKTKLRDIEYQNSEMFIRLTKIAYVTYMRVV